MVRVRGAFTVMVMVGVRVRVRVTVMVSVKVRSRIWRRVNDIPSQPWTMATSVPPHMPFVYSVFGLPALNPDLEPD